MRCTDVVAVKHLYDRFTKHFAEQCKLPRWIIDVVQRRSHHVGNKCQCGAVPRN